METLAYTYAHLLLTAEPRGAKNQRSRQWLSWSSLSLLLVAVSLNASALPASANRRVSTPHGGCLNVRSGPGMEYSVLRCVASGTPLSVTQAQGSWVQLASGDWTFGPYTIPSASRGGGTGGRPPCPGLNGLPVLDLGSRGASVVVVQEALQKLGYTAGAFGADGIYGLQTKAAVREFQKVYNLLADGQVGPATWYALAKAVDGGPSRPPVEGNPGVPAGDRVALNPVDANAEVVANATVRFGPTAGSEITGESLSVGMTVTVLETLNDWHRLKGESLTLWVPVATLQRF